MTIMDEPSPTRRGLPSRALPWRRTCVLHQEAKAGATRRAVRSVAIATAVSVVAGVLSVALLAAHLSPVEFGLIAMVAPLIVLLMAVSETGLDTHRVQSDEFNHERLSVSFWHIVGVAFALTLLFIAAAPALAWVFATPDVIPLAIAMSPLLLVSALKAQHDAICKQFQRQDLWACASGTGAVAGLVAAIVLVRGGAGVWAFVGMMLARTGIHVVLIWAFTGWVPGVPRALSHSRGLLGAGRQKIRQQIIMKATRVFDKMLLGWIQGAAVVGNYQLSFQMVFVPLIQLQYPVQSLAVPHMHAARYDKDAFAGAVGRISAAIALLVWPLMIAIALTADLIVPVLFGDQWRDSAPILSLLAIASVPFVLRQILGWALEALGNTAGALRWHAIGFCVLIFGVFAGLPWGGAGVATGLIIAEAVMLISAPFLLRGPLRVAIPSITSALMRPTAIAALAVFASSEVRMIAEDAPDIVKLGLVGVLLLTIGALGAWQAQSLFVSNTAASIGDAPDEAVKDQARADRQPVAVP